MSKSLAAVFDGIPRRLELREFPVPQPQGQEIVVRVHGCTLCGSDLHSYEGRRAVPVPTVLGHEIVGEIETLGESAPRFDLAGNSLQAGDRIVWAIVASCGECFYCRRGLPQKCQRAVKYGHEAFQPGRELLGGLAEHCLLVPGTAIVKLPDEIPLATACPASCATATIVAALEAAGDVRDRTVCVLGAGLLGLTASAMARAHGCLEKSFASTYILNGPPARLHLEPRGQSLPKTWPRPSLRRPKGRASTWFWNFPELPRRLRPPGR